MDGASAAPALSGAHVLVVEDEADVRSILATLLQNDGAQVSAAATGREALELIGRAPCAIVVTDFGLPDMPGDALIRQMLASVKPRPRIIVVTAYGEPYITRAREAGADVVVQKPFDWPVLARHIRAAWPTAA